MHKLAEMSNASDAPRPFKPGDIVEVLRATGNWQLCSIISIDSVAQSALFQPVNMYHKPTSSSPFDSVLERTRHKRGVSHMPDVNILSPSIYPHDSHIPIVHIHYMPCDRRAPASQPALSNVNHDERPRCPPVRPSHASSEVHESQQDIRQINRYFSKKASLRYQCTALYYIFHCIYFRASGPPASTPRPPTALPPTPPPLFFKPNGIVEVMRSNGQWVTCRVISIDIQAASALFQPLDTSNNPAGDQFDTIFSRVRPQDEGGCCSICPIHM